MKSNNPCILQNNGKEKASLLLDFGKELHGGLQITTWFSNNAGKNVRLRIRFGESAMEAMSELGGEKNATNDHAIRDQIVEIPFLGTTEVGNTGFRFVRIDLLDENCSIELKSLRAIFVYRDLDYKGSFTCSDTLLNKIWQTGAYTVHLNMQDYVWDGIKRDRLVWIGDLHPEVATIQTVFGSQDIVKESLDLIRDETPLPEWMNHFPSYSMWWVIIQHDYYLYNGDDHYLREQKDYLVGLLKQLASYVEPNGTHALPNPFLDWPSSENKQAVEAGIHALFLLTMKKGAKLCRILKEHETSKLCEKTVEKLQNYVPDPANNKQAAALLVLAGLLDSKKTNAEILSKDGARRISTFLGYYVLKARAEAGDINGCLDVIRQYWGGMLSLGATTFWEHFDISWLENAARIDEIPAEGKIDVHGEYGDYCYKGYRHSLCHGWASGPTAWLAEYVLGIKVLEPGCKVVQIIPTLGDLEWAEGTFPTPYGNIYVKHEKREDGTNQSTIQAPKEIQILQN